MRTPLNAVIGLADLACREDSIPDKVRDYLEKIRHSGKQLLTLVNDILDMSRIEHGVKNRAGLCAHGLVQMRGRLRIHVSGAGGSGGQNS